jgi:squalene-hopene/tetraprenyl-beta-curcumene cyclase
MNLKDEFGIDSESDIAIRDVDEHQFTAREYAHRGKSYTVSFRQHYHGIPIYGRLNIVSMNKYGDVYLVKNFWQPHIDAPFIPRISQEDIKEWAKRHYKAKWIDFFQEPKLFIYPPSNLVWRLQLGEPVHKEVLVDAVTGKVLKEKLNLISQTSNEKKIQICGTLEALNKYRRGEKLPRPPFGPDTVSTAHFIIHYTTTGQHQTTRAYAESVAIYAEYCWQRQIEDLNWASPPPDNNAGGDDRYDIYIRVISDSVMGRAIPDGRYSDPYPDGQRSYIEINTGLDWNSLRVTVAHEFNHACQFRYSDTEDDFFYENTSTWLEDVCYDDVNRYIEYLSLFNPHSNPLKNPEKAITTIDTNYEYAGAIWTMFLHEKYDISAPRRVWERMGVVPNQNTFPSINWVLTNYFNSDLNTALKEYAVWRYFTGMRADNLHFEEAALWPTSQIAVIYPTYPAYTTGRYRVSSPGGTRFIECHNPLQQLNFTFNGVGNYNWGAYIIGYRAGGTSDEFEISLDEYGYGNRRVSYTNQDYFVLVPIISEWNTSVSDANYAYGIGEEIFPNIPDDHCYIYGTVYGNRDGQGENYQPLYEVSCKIYDNTPLIPNQWWQGFSNTNGLYNTENPYFASIWRLWPIWHSSLYVKTELDGPRVRVVEHPDNLVQVQTVPFQPENLGIYNINTQFSTDVQKEGSCAYREMYRGWGCTWGHSPKQDKVRVVVHAATGPSTNGVVMYFPRNRARLPGDTQLHEFAHTIMYEKYGDQWPSGHTTGHPAQCPHNCQYCTNHGGNGNECSADAIIEGWANYFPVATYFTDPAFDNPPDSSYNWSNSTDAQDLENNSALGPLGANNGGARIEAAIASILWDLFDPVNPADEDHIDWGGGEVWHLFMELRPYTTKEFYQDAYYTYSLSRAELWQIFNAHGINDDEPVTQVPTQFSPANGQTVEGRIVSLKWNPIFDQHWYYTGGPTQITDQEIASGVLYDIQIATDSSFNNLVVDQTEASTIFRANLVPGTYYWRVRGKDYARNTPGNWSQTMSFTNTEISVIAKGLAWLRANQNADGGWGDFGSDVGITGLAVLSFLNYGYTTSDSAVSRGIQYILSRRNANGSFGQGSFHNYWTAIAILALVAADKTNTPRLYETQITTAKNFLLSTQNVEANLPGITISNRWYGGWNYSSATSSRADLSNTQWVLMGLDAAYSYLNLPKPDPYDTNGWTYKAIRFISRCQNLPAFNDQAWARNTSSPSYNDGGLIYQPDGNSLAGSSRSYGSMTAAGVWSYRLCGLSSSDARVIAALRWLDSTFSVVINPGMQYTYQGGYSFLYYYYTTLSKAFCMVGKTEAGRPSRDWYAAMSDTLRRAQKPEGYWVNPQSWAWENNKELVTSYALLSLQTRTLPPGVTLSMSIILASYADLHVYDPQGRHMGMNYQTGILEFNIPGANLQILPDGTQIANLSDIEAGLYRIELVGTGTGDYNLTFNGYQDSALVVTRSFAGSIIQGETQSTEALVTAMEGGLTLFVDPPRGIPGGLVAIPGNQRIDLSWNKCSGAVGYKIYYDTDMSGPPYQGTGALQGPSPIDVGDTSSFCLTGLTNGITYYITVTGYDSLGVETGYSNEVSAVPGIYYEIHDCGVTSVLYPKDTIHSGTLVIPMALVENFGNVDESLPVIFNIERIASKEDNKGYEFWSAIAKEPVDGKSSDNINVYTDTQFVVIPAGTIDTVSFEPWLSTPCNYQTVCYTALLNDTNNANDTAKGTVLVSYHDAGVSSVIIPTDTVISTNPFSPKVSINYMGISAVCTVNVKIGHYRVKLDSLCIVSENPNDFVLVYDSSVVTSVSHGLNELTLPMCRLYWGDIYWINNPTHHLITVTVKTEGDLFSQNDTLTKAFTVKSRNYDLQMNYVGLLNGTSVVYSDTIDIRTYNTVSVASNSPFGPTASYRARYKITRMSDNAVVYQKYLDRVLAPQSYSCLYFSTGWTPTQPGKYKLSSWIETRKGVDSVSQNNAVERIIYVRNYCEVATIPNKQADITGLPKVFSLSQNQPNPFYKTTVIRWQVPIQTRVKINIYDISGRNIKTLVNDNFRPGYYTTVWDRTDNNNRKVPSGIYVYEMLTDNFVCERKMVILK